MGMGRVGSHPFLVACVVASASIVLGQHTGNHGYPQCDLCSCSHTGKGQAIVKAQGIENTTDANCNDFCSSRQVAHNGTCVWDGGCRTQCSGDYQWGSPNPCSVWTTRSECKGEAPVANTCRFTATQGSRPALCEACYTCVCYYGKKWEPFHFRLHSDTPVSQKSCEELCPAKEGQERTIRGPCGGGSCGYCGGCKQTQSCVHTAHGCDSGSDYECRCQFANATVAEGCLGPP